MSVLGIRKTEYIVYLNVGLSSIPVYTNKAGFNRIIERVKKYCVVSKQEDEFLDFVHFYCYVDGEEIEIARIENHL